MLVAAAAASVATTATSLLATGAAVASSTASSTVDTSTVGQVTSAIASALPSAITTATPVTAARIGLPVSFEVAAIFAGALSGAMLGVNRRFDLTGVFMLALVNGLGGGILRDLLLQDQGVFALENPHALLSALIAGVLASFFISFAERLRPAIRVVDAFSLALFCLVGADKALVSGLTAIPAIVLGTVTSVGGGVIRDILTGEVPQVMRRGSLYSIAAFSGTTVFVLLASSLHVTKPIAVMCGGLVAFMLRVGSLWFGWESPEPLDITPTVVEVPRRLLISSLRLLRPNSRAASPTRTMAEDAEDDRLKPPDAGA